MTTAQIIIYILLFLLDLSLTVDYVNNYKNKRNDDVQTIIFMGSMFRISIIWLVIVGATLSMNQLKSSNPCPELEKVENVYKIKP